MKHIKLFILSILISISIVYFLTAVFSTLSINYHPTTQDIEENNLKLNIKFTSIFGIKIESVEFYKTQEELFVALGTKAIFLNKLSYYYHATKLSIQYILILIPVLFFILYTKENRKIKDQ